MANPIESTISNRYSVRNWTSDSVSSTQVLDILRSTYGFSNNHRTIPLVGESYCLELFISNSTGTYKYDPENQRLSEHSLFANKDNLRSRFSQSYPSDAQFVVIIVWDQTINGNANFASTQVGLLAQNMYLATIANELGTVAIALIDSQNLAADLNLPNTKIPLLVMPIGYPTSPYPSASPDSTRMNGNLPTVQLSSKTFNDALKDLSYATEWANQEISTQSLSQLLWASYGYSSTGHRTVPSANSAYALAILFSNSTGIYSYNPDNHSVSQIITGDFRLNIASACGNQNWAANAPTLFAVAYDSNSPDGGIVPHEYPLADAGCVIQNILLEAAALNLAGNLLYQGLEQWNGPNANTLRNLLLLPQQYIPLYVIPIGTQTTTPINPTQQPTNFPTASPTNQIPTPTKPIPTSSPTLEPTATIPELTIIAALLLIIITTIFTTIIKTQKNKKTRQTLGKPVKFFKRTRIHLNYSQNARKTKTPHYFEEF